MTQVRVKGFKIFRDRHGKMRCYHRATGAPVDLMQAPLGSVEFFAECARINELVKISGPPKPGTLGLLVEGYRSSSEFQDLAPRTQKDYQRCLDYLKPITDTALISFDRPLIVRIRDKAGSKHGRRFGNYVKAVLSIVFSWGLERGYVDANPAERVKNIRRKKGAPRANRPWADEERFAVLEAAPWGLKVPLALAMFTGLRQGDALTLTKNAYDGHNLEIITRKNEQRVWWPVPVSLKEILDNAPKHDAVTLAANSRGHPWTESGFRASWRTLRLRLEKDGQVAPGLTFHGLRHTVATILREEGFDYRTIADALGQKTEAMARHYTRDADLRKKMTGVVQRLDLAENKRRSKVVKPT